MAEKRRYSLALILLLFCFPVKLSAEPGTLAALEKARTTIVSVESETRAAIRPEKPFLVKDPDSNRLGLVKPIKTSDYRRKGTGVILDTRGLVVTNAHTVSASSRIKVATADSGNFEAKLLYLDRENDLAFLIVQPGEPGLTPAVLADSDAVGIGDTVYSITGSPFLNGTISEGTITGLGEKKHPEARHPYRNELLQTNLTIYRGDSGSALFDEKGQLLGILSSAQTKGPFRSFAISSNAIRYAYLSFMEKNKK